MSPSSRQLKNKSFLPVAIFNYWTCGLPFTSKECRCFNCLDFKNSKTIWCFFLCYWYNRSGFWYECARTCSWNYVTYQWGCTFSWFYSRISIVKCGDNTRSKERFSDKCKKREYTIFSIIICSKCDKDIFYGR